MLSVGELLGVHRNPERKKAEKVEVCVGAKSKNVPLEGGW